MKDRKVEEKIEVIIGKRIIAEKEVEVGLEKDHFQGILIIEGMIEAYTIVDQDLDQEQVQIEIELGVIGVENIISKKTALHLKKKEK